MECNYIGEVIGADTQWLDVESVRLHHAPHFGSFVHAECVGRGFSYFGVVTGIATGPLDSQRVVQAFHLAPGELEQRLPHLALLHRTTFRVRLIGYGEGPTRVTGTPPGPPRLHCRVSPAAPEEIRSVTRTPNFLRPLTQVPDVPLEDLLVCAMQAAREAWGHEAPVGAWAKYLARLLQRDYVTLESVVERLQPAAAAPPPVRAPVPAPATVPRSSAVQARTVATLEQKQTMISNGTPKRVLGPDDDPFTDA